MGKTRPIKIPQASEGVEAVKQGLKIHQDLDEVFEWLSLARSRDQRTCDLHPEQDQVVIDGAKDASSPLLDGETLTYSLQANRVSLKVERDHREVCSASATRSYHDWEQAPIYQIHAQTPQGTYFIYQTRDFPERMQREDYGQLTFTPRT